MKIIQPGATLALDDQNAFYRVTGGWKRLGASTLWGVADIREYPPVDPPSYRVTVVRSTRACGTVVPPAETLALAEQISALTPPPLSYAYSSISVPPSQIEGEPTNSLPPDTTSSLNPTLKWSTLTTVAKDLGTPSHYGKVLGWH